MATKQAEKYKEEGNQHFKAGDHAKAIECYTYATELDPKNPIFYTNRSNAYFLMKNYEKSERDARKAIKCKDSWEKGWYRLGMALQAVEKYAEALEAFKKACELKPDNATFASAQTACKSAMMKGMSSAEILKIEGNEAFKAGKIEEAVTIYTKCIDACKATDAETKQNALCNRAACYRNLYLPEECIKDCTKVLEMNATNIKALIRRAQAYESMEKYKKALADFEAAMRIDPNAEVAYTGANRLRTSMKKLGIL